MNSLTVMILTFNEERHIARAIDSVASIASAVIVIDSHSTDRTIEIASAKGATVLKNKFVSQAQQFQWAIDNTQVDSTWVMRLDADEVVSPKLAAEIAQRLDALPAQVVGIKLRRRHIWMGRWVRHGGRYPVVLLRIWRRGHGRVEDRWMDEHMLVWGGETITFACDFADENLNDIGYFVDKHNKYATREAIEVINRRVGLFAREADVRRRGGSSVARLTHWLKDSVYPRIPFTVTAPGYFLWRYIVLLGFLDGRSGLTYHFMQSCWYRFLIGAKVMELEQAIAHLTDKHEIARELSRLTGQPVRADTHRPAIADSAPNELPTDARSDAPTDSPTEAREALR
jgi:glycosyltransferase involved in cell wall biosynthesis